METLPAVIAAPAVTGGPGTPAAPPAPLRPPSRPTPPRVVAARHAKAPAPSGQGARIPQALGSPRPDGVPQPVAARLADPSAGSATQAAAQRAEATVRTAARHAKAPGRPATRPQPVAAPQPVVARDAAAATALPALPLPALPQPVAAPQPVRRPAVTPETVFASQPPVAPRPVVSGSPTHTAPTHTAPTHTAPTHTAPARTVQRRERRAGRSTRTDQHRGTAFRRSAPPARREADDARGARLRIMAHPHPGVRATRWGIAVALGAATIAFPVVGVKGLIEPYGLAQAASAGTPRATSVLAPVAFLAIASDPAPAGELPAEAISPEPVPVTPEELTATRVRAEQVAANQSHAALPDCDGVVKEPDAENGRLNPDHLCVLPWAAGQDDMVSERRLRPDAALALGRLNAAYYTEFGTDLCVGDTYRSYEEQAAAKARKPGLAAAAGSSNHGWALAADLCGGVETDTTEQWRWMSENAPAYGWNNPDWARTGGRGPHEPWHWEYVAAVKEKRAANAAANATARSADAGTRGSASTRTSGGGSSSR